ncbi:cytochrome b/b6 domain-containing protein [Bosea sp. 117]|uniref:cytochrome b/b6 domain-containing protein n=1 Tax=Bosea sp. 117 TaxID=1125973 RepID=UPI0009DCDC40|nr:cytochrome b/b6 domain-containing protein [Bosea sp. 117]
MTATARRAEAAQDALPGAAGGGVGREGGSVLAWDLPTRLAKWALAVLVGLAFASKYYGDLELVWHMWNGLAILVVVVFRVLWGFVGGSTARFTRFLADPLRAIGYLVALLRGRAPRFLGHNPLGGWMVVALLAAVAAQAVTGLFTTDDIIVDGPLVRVASEETVASASGLHQRIYWVMLALVAVHIVVNIGYSLVGKDNLIRAMLTGRKPRAVYADQPAATAGSIVKALACLAVSLLVVFGGIALAGGDPFP